MSSTPDIPRGAHAYDSREPNPPRASAARRAEVLAALDDVPEHVESVGMLRSGRCDVVEAEPHGDGVCLVHDERPLVSVFGEPGARAIRYALGSLGDGAELIAQTTNVEHVLESLPTWSAERAVVHTLPDARLDLLLEHADDVLDGAQGPTSPRASVLSPDDVSLLASLPYALRAELREALPLGAVSAVWPDSRTTPDAPGPVAFCYAPSISASLWDVSVDCHAPHRRRGFATAAFLHQLRRLHRRGVRPVWGALESNDASLAMAGRLGFEPVADVYVVTRDED